jgi:hypothetical protein
MKNDNTFIIAAMSICFMVFSFVHAISLYEVAIDWRSLSSIIFGAYLYFAYLMLSIFLGKQESKRRSFPTSAAQIKKQRIYRNEIYEY